MLDRLQSVFAPEREVWIRFLGALIGLALAFIAALFSTVYAQSGNVIVTAILASVALLLAGWVGLTTVPYLAKRVAVARVRDVLDYDVTREGAVYMVLVLVVGIAALNTGNNLLFIVVSALLGAIVISGIASAAMLRRMEMDIGLPEHVFAKDSVIGRITLRNLSNFWPAFSVSVVPPKVRAARIKWVLHRSTFRWPPKAAPDKQWIKIPDLYLTRVAVPGVRADILAKPVYYPYVPSRSSANAEVELLFSQRGRFIQDGFGVATRFPFSFLTKTRRVPLAHEIVVYPPVEPTDELFEILPMITGEFEAFVAGRGYDLYRIREYLPDDSARHVDWKATAKTGALKVREFTREDERKLRFVFDNPSPGLVRPAKFEQTVNVAASLAWHFSEENTELSFVAPEPLAGSDVYGFLRYLALVEPRRGKSVLEAVKPSDDYNIIFTARPRGSIPTGLWNCSYFIFFE